MLTPGLLAATCVAAYLTATLSGVLGMGGGVVLLAVFFLAGIDPLVALPLHAAVQLVSNGSRVLAFLGFVRWWPAATLAAASLPGPLLGLWLLDRLDPAALQAALGVVILVATWTHLRGLGALAEGVAFGIAGALVGVLGVLVGATGPLIAPFFLREHWQRQEIVGTKAACQAFTHVQKLVAFGLLAPALIDLGWITRAPRSADWLDPGVLVPMVVAVVAGTWTGKQLLGRISEERFRRLYKAVLTLVAIRLVLAPLSTL